jgi:hypothetical protein
VDWALIKALHDWERENFPGFESPQGREVFVWLLKSQQKARPLKDLYQSSRFSEPTLRACLKAFAERGYCALIMRARYAQTTAALMAVLAGFQEKLRRLSIQIDGY